MTDVRLEKVIGTLLQVGVLAAAAVVLAGGVWLAPWYGSGVTRSVNEVEYGPFERGGRNVRSPA